MDGWACLQETLRIYNWWTVSADTISSAHWWASFFNQSENTNWGAYICLNWSQAFEVTISEFKIDGWKLAAYGPFKPTQTWKLLTVDLFPFSPEGNENLYAAASVLWLCCDVIGCEFVVIRSTCASCGCTSQNTHQTRTSLWCTLAQFHHIMEDLSFQKIWSETEMLPCCLCRRVTPELHLAVSTISWVYPEVATAVLLSNTKETIIQ